MRPRIEVEWVKRDPATGYPVMPIKSSGWITLCCIGFVILFALLGRGCF